MRRRPVPRAWRDEHHSLDTRISSITGYGWHRSVRVKGYCSCGARFPEGEHTDNMGGDEVRDAWRDHVEDAYYAEKS